MAAKILDGKLVADYILDKVKDKIDECKLHNLSLCFIRVGDDPASEVYVRNKERACEKIGIKSHTYVLHDGAVKPEIIDLIENLNNDDTVGGILLQLPLPDSFDWIDEIDIINAIAPSKDVDCFVESNVGTMFKGDSVLVPCTPYGIMEMLDYYDINVTGMNCVVIGRSDIVGKPMAMMLLHNNATVTICHSYTENLKDICKRADLIVSAVGKPKFINRDYVGDGAIVIDVGMNRDENGKLCGDVDFDGVVDVASYITPVPGGVGRTTVAALMMNFYNTNCSEDDELL